MLATIVIVMLTLLTWPFRILWRELTGVRSPNASISRLIVVGLDGQDPLGGADFLLPFTAAGGDDPGC